MPEKDETEGQYSEKRYKYWLDTDESDDEKFNQDRWDVGYKNGNLRAKDGGGPCGTIVVKIDVLLLFLTIMIDKTVKNAIMYTNYNYGKKSYNIKRYPVASRAIPQSASGEGSFDQGG